MATELSIFGKWLYTCDRIATAKAYSDATTGSVDICTCNACRNFVLVRDQVFPPVFIQLLQFLGIDPHKDGEIYHNGRLAPGRHDYAGWFHFVGSLDRTGDYRAVHLGDGFTAWLCERSAPALPPLRGKQLVQVEFHSTNVPWRLNEPETI